MLRSTGPLLITLLASCGAGPTPAAQTNAADPAITAALSDPIMADPQLDRRANRDVLRPDDDPFRAAFPPGSPQTARAASGATLLARMEGHMARTDSGFTGCDRAIRYSYGWAAKLPTALTLPLEARVAEAAGSDAASCHLRLVAYSAALAPAAVLGRYRDVARNSGYSLSETSQGGATMIAARRRDGAAFVASVEPGDGGSIVDLATNRGR